MTKQTIIIAGFGRIGVKIANMLCTQYQIIGLKRTAIQSKHTVLLGDVTNQSHLIEVIQRYQPIAIIIIMTPAERTKIGYQQSYLAAVTNVIECCHSTQQKPHVGFVSSTAVYGQNDGSWVDENTSKQPQRFNGQVLLQCEQRLANSKLPHIIWQPSGIYQQSKPPNTQRLLNLDNDRWSNVIELQDVCHAMVQTLQLQLPQNKPKSNCYIITDSMPYLSSQLLRSLGIQPPQKWSNKAISGKRCSNHKILKVVGSLQYPKRF